MAIAARRAKASQEEVENEAQAEAQRAMEANVAARSALVDRWFQVVVRFGRGVSLWQERGWEWEEPDWGSDPETWPPLARILYLHKTVLRIEHDLGFLEAAGAKEPICQECVPERPGHARYVRVLCEEHAKKFIVWSVQYIAHTLFGSPGLAEREQEMLAEDASVAAFNGERPLPKGFTTPLCTCGDKRSLHEAAKHFCLRAGCTCQAYRTGDAA